MSEFTRDQALAEVLENARYGELEELEEFVKIFGKEILLSRDYNQATLVHMSAANGHLDILNYLIKNLPKEHLHLSNLDGNTPLHWAALTGNLEAVKLLLDNGADGKLTNSAGHTPMGVAQRGNHESVVEYLLINTDYENTKDDDGEAQPSDNSNEVNENGDDEEDDGEEEEIKISVGETSDKFKELHL